MGWRDTRLVPRRFAIGVRFVAFVGERGARKDVVQCPTERKLRTVAGLAACQQEGDGQPFEVRLQMDFRGKAAARPTERTDFPAPFCAGCRYVRAHHGRVEHLDEMRGFAEAGEGFEEKLKHAGMAQSPNRFQTLFQFPNSLATLAK